ncbi:hypothetical protein K3495_g16475, partial [Podosphaera aphanis]
MSASDNSNVSQAESWLDGAFGGSNHVKAFCAKAQAEVETLKTTTNTRLIEITDKLDTTNDRVDQLNINLNAKLENCIDTITKALRDTQASLQKDMIKYVDDTWAGKKTVRPTTDLNPALVQNNQHKFVGERHANGAINLECFPFSSQIPHLTEREQAIRNIFPQFILDSQQPKVPDNSWKAKVVVPVNLKLRHADDT